MSTIGKPFILKMKPVALTELGIYGGYAMKMKRMIFTGVATLLAFRGSSLLAGTLSNSHTTTPQTAPFTDNFTLTDYTPTLGNILTGITISLSWTTAGSVDIFNTATSPAPFTNAGTLTPLTLTAPASLSLTPNAVGGPVSGTAAASVETMVPGAGSGMPPTAGLTLAVPMADWGSFEGTGTFSASLAAGTTSFSVTLPPGSPLFYRGGGDLVGGVTTITYTFVPTSTTTIPEPATMGLIGSALLGIGFFAFRRRIKKA
jgi:hypothetical protein